MPTAFDDPTPTARVVTFRGGGPRDGAQERIPADRVKLGGDLEGYRVIEFRGPFTATAQYIHPR